MKNIQESINQKDAVVHDGFGNEISVGDLVAFPHMASKSIKVGIISKLNTYQIQGVQVGRYRTTPRQCICLVHDNRSVKFDKTMELDIDFSDNSPRYPIRYNPGRWW